MSLIGHDHAWQAWRSAAQGGRMHHAWLLAGQSGIGKAQFAFAAAHELVRGEVGSPHPDIVHLARAPKDKKEADKKEAGKPFETARNIKVDQIRSMQRVLTTRPTMGDKRVIIVDPADDMERSASNALLKSLEEPPIGTYFVLVSHSPAKLLPTVRSRCRTLRFPDLTIAEMQAVLSTLAPEANGDELDAAILAGAGSPGAALRFLEFGLDEIARLMNDIAEEGDAGFVLRGQLAARVGGRPSREHLRAVLDLARSIVAGNITQAEPAAQSARIAAHEELVRLTGEMATYNYDPGLLIMEIGTLLARVGQASERANV
ncbi:DNA polymerase III subunit delta' [Erythrobacter sp. W53]|uniref:DNA polymerase III subunit delta' n=1 Tax=Erythrobacter sp. W53 TaxID=3425947 RepID=UPI003D7690E1